MSNPRLIIKELKCSSFADADSKALAIRNTQGHVIGKLIPVGDWIISDKEKIEIIAEWRQKAMGMFLTQFQSSYERTLNYLRTLSINQEDRILFLIYNENNDFIGHIGIANLRNNGFELDNLVRGIAGSNPRLIYFAELSLLDWCFKTLKLLFSDARVLSYNWLAIALHEELGYVITERIPLLKSEKGAVIFHSITDPKNSNVNYNCTKMFLHRDVFFEKRASSLTTPASADLLASKV